MSKRFQVLFTVHKPSNVRETVCGFTQAFKSNREIISPKYLDCLFRFVIHILPGYADDTATFNKIRLHIVKLNILLELPVALHAAGLTL